MSSSSIEKDKVLAAVVRTFFKYFVTGIVESQSDLPMEERFEPRNVKRIMLEQYESISRYFNKEVFFAIFRMNYTPDEMERELRSFMTDKTTDMDLVRFACRTEEFYAMMVSEYKRNFELLLLGRIDTPDGRERDFTPCPSAGHIDEALAERIIAEVASNAYAHGKNIKTART